MIIYFSGTGNTEYVAKTLGACLGESVTRLTDGSPSEIGYSGNVFVVVFPIYSWGVPPIVLDYINNLNDSFISSASRHRTYMVCICGDETASYLPCQCNTIWKNDPRQRAVFLF